MLSKAQSQRIRLDDLLVRRGLFATRSRARDAIERGTVSVGGTPALKPGVKLADDAEINVDDPASRYVSRAALKLAAGLDVFKFDPGELTALDLGASTGGFTQVLLQRGARHVLAVDVGRDQMNATLRSDPRVTCIEGLNARDLTSADLGRLVPQALVCDVSFISLKLALPPALTLAAPGAWGVFLVKPQFEAGRAAIGKGGLLRDKEDADRIAADLTDWLNNQPGWRSTGLTPSPIRGQDGNREFLLGGVKDQ
jgi:23S rRNA (cytidine1920-2'-O)/16S rRNA (cytidine1409-2'-O)-methyltransferase